MLTYFPFSTQFYTTFLPTYYSISLFNYVYSIYGPSEGLNRPHTATEIPLTREQHVTLRLSFHDYGNHGVIFSRKYVLFEMSLSMVSWVQCNFAHYSLPIIYSPLSLAVMWRLSLCVITVTSEHKTSFCFDKGVKEHRSVLHSTPCMLT